MVSCTRNVTTTAKPLLTVQVIKSRAVHRSFWGQYQPKCHHQIGSDEARFLRALKPNFKFGTFDAALRTLMLKETKILLGRSAD